MKMELSHNDLVKLGVHESKRGHSLNEIEADFSKKGISRKDTLKALKEVEYYKKRDEALKAKETAVAKKLQDKTDVDAKSTAEKAQSAEKKSSLWISLLVIFVLVGLAIFYYFYNNKF